MSEQLERQFVVRAIAGWRGRRRAALAKRLHQLEVDLLKLAFDVRQLEQNIIEADIDELRRRFGQRAPRPPDL